MQRKHLAVLSCLVLLVLASMCTTEETAGPVAQPAAKSQPCVAKEDCVPSECCHPSACTSKAYELDCKGVACTQECRAGTMDCGQGYCDCVQGECKAVIVTVNETATNSTPA